MGCDPLLFLGSGIMKLLRLSSSVSPVCFCSNLKCSQDLQSQFCLFLLTIRGQGDSSVENTVCKGTADRESAWTGGEGKINRSGRIHLVIRKP